MVTTGDRIAFEDLSKAGEVLDQRQTPFLTRMGMGPKLKLHDYYSQGVDTRAKRITRGVPEGKDVDGFEKGKQQKISARGQKFWRRPAVSVEAEAEADQSTSQLLADYNKQVGEKIVDQKRDIDVVMLSDQESQEDDGVNGYFLRGIGRWINDGAKGAATAVGLDSPLSPDQATGNPSLAFNDAATAIPTVLRTPAAQIYADALVDLDEADVNTIMQNRWRHAGAMVDFTLWCADGLKGHISDNFGRYQSNKEGYTPIMRTNVAPIDKRRLVTTGIDVLEGDYGTLTIELEPWMPTTERGYGVEMSVLKKRIMWLTRHYPLENKGGGKRGLIESILGAWFDDPRKHFKIAPSTEVAAVVDYEF